MKAILSLIPFLALLGMIQSFKFSQVHAGSSICLQVFWLQMCQMGGAAFKTVIAPPLSA